ncbi:MAG: LTA synthase family protein, partial [Phycisphaerae bacterium]|nr:LTA synthase family protein [Phycisphaerae bacterium]
PLNLLFDAQRLTRGLRLAVGLSFILLTTTICRLDLLFFDEFDDQFNHFLHGLLHEDIGAIAQTATGQHSLAWEIPLILLLAVVNAALFCWFIRPRAPGPGPKGPPTPRLTQLTICAVAGGLYFSAASGPIWKTDYQMLALATHPNTSYSPFVHNPYSALVYVVRENRNHTGVNAHETLAPDGSMRTAFATVRRGADPMRSVDDAFRRQARGPKGKPPRHVFVVVMESYDAWPLLDEYQSLQMAAEIKSLGTKGILIQKFLPAAHGSIRSLTSIVSGLPYVGPLPNQQPTSRELFPSSLAGAFQRLGYRTRMFSSGYERWQNAAGYFRNQGFQEVYTAEDLTPSLQPTEWGAHDTDVYNFALETIDDDVPSFNFIDTASNHPPYDLDVFAMGYPVRTLPKQFEEAAQRGRLTPKIAGHFWYADRAAADFVERIETRLPRALFALTGDHVSRRFPTPRPTLYERSTVPLLLYGPGILPSVERPQDLIGTHVDIGPTLIELAAPADFEYYSSGFDVLGPEYPHTAHGSGRIIGRDFICEPRGGFHFEPMPGGTLPDPLPNLDKRMRWYSSVCAITLWRIRNGPSLPLEVRSTSGTEKRD